MTDFEWPVDAAHVADATPVAWLELPPSEFARGAQRRGTWLDFRALLCRSRFACPSGCTGHKCPEKSRHGAIACGEYQGAHRDAEHVVSSSIVGLDFDAVGEAAMREAFSDLRRRNLAFAAHSTHSGLDSWRLFLPLATPVTPRHWSGFRQWLALLELPWVAPLEDSAARDIARLWFCPTAGINPVAFEVGDGHPLRPLVWEPRPVAPRRPAPRWAPPGDPLRRARHALHRLGPAVEGQSGDHRTYWAACLLVRDLALTESQAFEVLSEWNATCSPPWSDEELRAKLRNAARYGRNPIGGAQ